MKKSRRHLVYDPYIVSRVKQYLEESTHHTHVNVADMARALQDKYRDYNRRKVAPFRQLVDNAYRIVLQSYGLASNSSSDAENLSDGSIECLDEEDQDPTPSGPPRNAMVDVMDSLYSKKPAAPAVAGPTDQEAANSSSTVQVPPQNPQQQPQLIAAGPPKVVAIDISSDEENNEQPIVTNNPQPNLGVRLGPDLSVNLIPRKDTDSIPVIPSSIENGVGAMKLAEKRLQEYENSPSPLQVKKKRKLAAFNTPLVSIVKATDPKATSTSTSSSTKKGAFKKDFPAKSSSVTFSDIGGVDKILKELCELLLHLKHPEVYEHIGITAPRGFLLHGPPGSGKTLLAHAIAGQLKVPLVEVAATELVAGISGESEERIREVFEKAATVAPCVLFIDEVDVISANRNNAQKDLERRIVSQLLSSLDSLAQLPNGNLVVVIGATNRADTLDPALRRVGRFDQEICLGIPDRKAREQILRIVCKKLKLEEAFDYDELAMLTPGYVGADLLALAMRAATIAVKRVFSEQDFGSSIVAVEEEKPKESVEEKNPETTEVVVAEEESKDPQTNEEQMDTASEVIDAEPITMDVEQTTTEADPIQGSGDDGPKEQKPIEATTGTEDKPTEEIHSAEKDKPIETSAALATKPRQHTLDEMMLWISSDERTPLSEEAMQTLRVSKTDFKSALAVVQPSAKREGFITVPDVTWENIGSLGDIRDELKMAILAPVKYPSMWEQLGLQSPSGVLLCGPPGCGKTLLAKAVANEAGINFISVKGPELLNMYVGESERAVRQCFQRAKNSAPCVIFFDEFDALCPKRSSRSDNTGGARVVNQLLTEMDGVEDRRGVFLMAATNRPDMIDGAVLRPGRLDKILYVGLPEAEDREDILRALTKGGTKPPLDADVSLKALSELTPGFTGADLGGLVREACMQAVRESLKRCERQEAEGADKQEAVLVVNISHFTEALKNVKSSISEEDKKNYERLRKLYGSGEK